jgi:hypothetical protein
MAKPALDPKQRALGEAIIALKACIAKLQEYLNDNIGNMDDPDSLEATILELQNEQVKLTLASIDIGLGKQSDLDALETVSKQLKSKLDEIDKDIARAAQVIALGIAILAVVKAAVPAIDPGALAAAVKQAGSALKAPKAG